MTTRVLYLADMKGSVKARPAALTAWHRWGRVVLVVDGVRRLIFGGSMTAEDALAASLAYDRGLEDGEAILRLVPGSEGIDLAVIEIDVTMADAEHPLRRDERGELLARAAGLCDAVIAVASVPRSR